MPPDAAAIHLSYPVIVDSSHFGRQTMNHTRITATRLILAALVAAVMLIALIGLPGSANPSAGQAAGVRLPRPHSQSHIELASVATLSPRPHPISHLSFPPGVDLLN